MKNQWIINEGQVELSDKKHTIRIEKAGHGGDSDVGDIFMLVTLWWWLISDVDDRIIIYVFRYVGDFLGHQHLKLVTNTFGLQHPSPTSM